MFPGILAGTAFAEYLRMVGGLRVAVPLLVVLTAPAYGEGLPSSPRADEALALCRSAEQASGAARETLLARGRTLAEDAVKDDDADATAHFALFCTLGRQMQLRTASPFTLAEMRRLRREIDRTLELAPRSVDALTAKGALLLELPWILGGDRREA